MAVVVLLPVLPAPLLEDVPAEEDGWTWPEPDEEEADALLELPDDGAFAQAARA